MAPKPRLVTLVVTLATALPVFGQSPLPSVATLRLPDGGIQPHLATGPDGAAHVVFLRGDARQADLFHAVLRPGESAFSKTVRVNSEAGSAVAMGTIRGGRVAVGAGGRVHVVWNGSGPAAGGLMYARMREGGEGFEAQRNLMKVTRALDGGGDIAVDPEGGVFAVWHASPREEKDLDETHRGIWVARSRDKGTTFETERLVGDAKTGVCACCGLAASVVAGRMEVLFRAATDGTERGARLLTATLDGKDARVLALDLWTLSTCPMSGFAMTEADGRLFLAWERAGQIRTDLFDPATGLVRGPRNVPGRRYQRRHPVCVGNARGQMLVAWTEGMVWDRPGSLHWVVLDRKGEPIPESAGEAAAVPAWDRPAACARPDGSFVLVY